MKQAGHKRTDITWLYLCEVPTVTKFMKTDSRIVAGGAGRGGGWGGERESVLGGRTVSVWGGCGEGCTAVCMHVMPPSGAPKGMEMLPFLFRVSYHRQKER